MSLTDVEYASLRRTIAVRGTARMALMPVIVLGWSALALGLLLTGAPPIATLFPLAALVAGFEAVHALHTGAERIGRYLQVYYETTAGGPRWETTAMAAGPALPGGGVDPLFTIVFASATAVNLLPALVLPPHLPTLAAIGAVHGAFLFRVVRARRAAARQRRVELARMSEILGPEGAGAAESTDRQV